MHVVTPTIVTSLQHLTIFVSTAWMLHVWAYLLIRFLFFKERNAQNLLWNKDVLTYEHKLGKVNQNAQDYSQTFTQIYLTLTWNINCLKLAGES